GSGKGTQARLLAERGGMRFIATGEILREAIRQQTLTGAAARPYLDAGRLVPDELVNQVVAEIFQRPDAPRCFVCDGYPRTDSQADWFDQFLKGRGGGLDAVLLLDVSDEEVVRRLGCRWTCSNPDCGASFHQTKRPPKRPGICDTCGWKLMQREDDRE